MICRRPITWWWLFLLATALPSRGADLAILNHAYELQAQGRMVESLASFQEFISSHPDHIQASLDAAGLLSKMNRHAEAAQRLEAIGQAHPGHETIQFKLAVERTALQEFDEAEALFRNLLASSNPAMVEAARDALGQLAKDRERQRLQAVEEKVFDLVRELKNEEALEAMAALETEQELSYPMALQRVYVLYNLGRFADASEKAQRLSVEHLRDTDLAFLRAELFMQLDSVAEANRLWRQIEEDHPGTFAADEARRRRNATRPSAPQQNLEREVYELAEAKRYQDVIQAVDQMEIEAGTVPLNMEMQRLYALYNLNYFDVALVEAEKLAEEFPSAIDLSLLRAELLVKLERPEEATAIWERIKQEVPGSAAALEARRRLQALLPADLTAAKEQKIFDLAGESKHREVVDAVAALEAEDGSISKPMAMQRLYALYALEAFQAAWEHAGTLLENDADDTDLAFLAAEILVKLGRPKEANDIWQRIAEDHAGNPVGRQASDRLQAHRQTEPSSPEEIRAYTLAGERKYGEVISTVDALEKAQGQVSHALAMQRLYALLATSQHDRALQEAESMDARPDAPPELALIRSEILIQRNRWEEAFLILRDLKRKHVGEPLHEEANRRLSGIPQVANLDRLHWGEAYASGDYYGRFDALIGSGFVRYGTFVPKARWLQPHAEFKFVVDTESEASGRPTIISDNHVGHYAGARLQLFKREYVFLYAQAGVNRDLLDQRDDGDYAFDYQAGIYGFKSWGPGVILRQPVEEDFQFGDGGSDISRIQTNGFFWRGDWFADASLNFSYYHRYSSWIGYAGVREGFRLFQIGPRLGFDTYLVQNIAWDVKGNYFDNFFEAGPGVRWLWTPCRNAQVVLRAEWHYGAYLGRNEEQRGGAASSYDEIVAGLSVGMRW